MFDGDLNGPLNKTASVFAGIFGQNAVNDAIVNAVVLDASNNPVTLTQAISKHCQHARVFAALRSAVGQSSDAEPALPAGTNQVDQRRRGPVRAGIAGLLERQHRTGAAVQRRAGLRRQAPQRNPLPVHPRPQQPDSADHRAYPRRAGRLHRRRQQRRHQSRQPGPLRISELPAHFARAARPQPRRAAAGDPRLQLLHREFQRPVHLRVARRVPGHRTGNGQRLEPRRDSRGGRRSQPVFARPRARPTSPSRWPTWASTPKTTGS